MIKIFLLGALILAAMAAIITGLGIYKEHKDLDDHIAELNKEKTDWVDFWDKIEAEEGVEKND